MFCAVDNFTMENKLEHTQEINCYTRTVNTIESQN